MKKVYFYPNNILKDCDVEPTSICVIVSTLVLQSVYSFLYWSQKNMKRHTHRHTQTHAVALSDNPL